MSRFLRLIALALLGLVFAPTAAATDYVETYSTEAIASSYCSNWQSGMVSNYGYHTTTDSCTRNVTTTTAYFFSRMCNASNSICSTYRVNFPVPADNCAARNVPEAGDTDGRGAADRWFKSGMAPSSYCSGGCTMNVWLSAAAPIHGWDGVVGSPTYGQPQDWTLHHQEWSGATCTAGDIGTGNNPPNSMGDPSSQPPLAAPNNWNCNITAATCTDPNGNPNYCSFNVDGTRKTCVPMSADSDGDGIPNSYDSAPNDATNGKDTTGTESDNVSTGGGNCIEPPHSSGDGIATQVAYQTWATRCAVEAQKTADAAASAASTAAIAAMNAANVAATAATTSATVGLGTKIDSLNSTMGAIASASNASAVASNNAAAAMAELNDSLTGTTTNPDTGTGPASAEAGGFLSTVEAGGDLDVSGLASGPGACPVILPVNVMGHSIAFDITNFCEWIKLGSILVVLSAAVLSLKILGS